MAKPTDADQQMTPRRWAVLYLLRVAFLASIAMFAAAFHWADALLMTLAVVLFMAGMWSDYAIPIWYTAPPNNRWRWPW